MRRDKKVQARRHSRFHLPCVHRKLPAHGTDTFPCLYLHRAIVVVTETALCLLLGFTLESVELVAPRFDLLGVRVRLHSPRIYTPAAITHPLQVATHRQPHTSCLENAAGGGISVFADHASAARSWPHRHSCIAESFVALHGAPALSPPPVVVPADLPPSASPRLRRQRSISVSSDYIGARRFDPAQRFCLGARQRRYRTLFNALQKASALWIVRWLLGHGHQIFVQRRRNVRRKLIVEVRCCFIIARSSRIHCESPLNVTFAVTFVKRIPN